MDELKNAAALLGTKGGQAKSEKKSKAVRENGKKGGRPKQNSNVLFQPHRNPLTAVLVKTYDDGTVQYYEALRGGKDMRIAYTPSGGAAVEIKLDKEKAAIYGTTWLTVAGVPSIEKGHEYIACRSQPDVIKDLKHEVIRAHTRKVNAWNRYITNVHSTVNYNQYLFNQDQFDQSTAALIFEYKLSKLRGN